MSSQRAKRVGLWGVTVLLALLFLAAGVTKLLGLPPHPESFQRWGFPLWFMYVTGALEVVAALLLVVPRTATVGASLVALAMLGSLVTHLKEGEFLRLPLPLVILGLATLVLLGRRSGSLEAART